MNTDAENEASDGELSFEPSPGSSSSTSLHSNSNTRNKTRMSYTIEKKLAVLERVEKGESIRSVGRSLGIHESVIRAWKRSGEKLKSFASVKKESLRKVRRVGCGKSASFPLLEQRLIAWVEIRNKQGLRVKDKFIIAHAKAIRDEFILALSSEDSGVEDAADQLV